MTKKLVFVRHGQSEWNLANKFTGWVDVDLSEKGVEEAKEAGRKIKEAGIKFDVAYTSILKRAIKTCNYVLEYSDQMYVPQYKTYRLNERHYGALQGLNKAETAEKYGDEQVHMILFLLKYLKKNTKNKLIFQCSPTFQRMLFQEQKT